MTQKALSLTGKHAVDIFLYSPLCRSRRCRGRCCPACGRCDSFPAEDTGMGTNPERSCRHRPTGECHVRSCCAVPRTDPAREQAGPSWHRETRGYSPHLWEQTNNQQFINLFEQFAQEQIRQGKIDLGALAGQFCITRTQLNRKVKAVSGLTSTDYIVRMRVKMAKDLLRNDSLSVKEVAYRCGIEDVPYFVTMFKKATGMTPGQYRHGGG